MNMVFICQEVDTESIVLASIIDIIKSFSQHPLIECVFVLSLKVGRYDLPKNVYVEKLQSPHAIPLFGDIRTTFILWKHVVQLQRTHKIDFIFVHMLHKVAAIVYPLKVLFGIPVFLWQSHPSTLLSLKFTVKFCVDGWFVINRLQAPYDEKHLHIVGQGVNIEVFYPIPMEKNVDFIVVGRLAPIKKVDIIIEGLAHCRDILNRDVTLLIVGDLGVQTDSSFREKLHERIRDLNIGHLVHFHGQAKYIELAQFYNRARCFVMGSPGGVGKVTVEAMACGVPLILMETKLGHFFPDELISMVSCEPNHEALGRAMAAMMQRSDTEREELGGQMRTLVESSYTFTALIARIMDHIRATP